MTISQREARRLKKRVRELEKQEQARSDAWAKEWPFGTDIGQAKFAEESKLVGSIITARKLAHEVVAAADTDGTVYFIALPLGENR